MPIQTWIAKRHPERQEQQILNFFKLLSKLQVFENVNRTRCKLIPRFSCSTPHLHIYWDKKEKFQKRDYKLALNYSTLSPNASAFCMNRLFLHVFRTKNFLKFSFFSKFLYKFEMHFIWIRNFIVALFIGNVTLLMTKYKNQWCLSSWGHLGYQKVSHNFLSIKKFTVTWLMNNPQSMFYFLVWLTSWMSWEIDSFAFCFMFVTFISITSLFSFLFLVIKFSSF